MSQVRVLPWVPRACRTSSLPLVLSLFPLPGFLPQRAVAHGATSGLLVIVDAVAALAGWTLAQLVCLIRSHSAMVLQSGPRAKLSEDRRVEEKKPEIAETSFKERCEQFGMEIW